MHEGWLYLRIAFLVLATRVVFRLLSLPAVVRWHTPGRRRRGPLRDPEAVAEELRVVQLMSRYLAGGNCLVRALVGLRVLRRHGYDARLRLGVRRVGPAGLEAHAWLENDDGLCLDRAGDAGGYVPLPPIVEGRRQPSRG